MLRSPHLIWQRSIEMVTLVFLYVTLTLSCTLKITLSAASVNSLGTRPWLPLPFLCFEKFSEHGTVLSPGLISPSPWRPLFTCNVLFGPQFNCWSVAVYVVLSGIKIFTLFWVTGAGSRAPVSFLLVVCYSHYLQSRIVRFFLSFILHSSGHNNVKRHTLLGPVQKTPFDGVLLLTEANGSYLKSSVARLPKYLLFPLDSVFLEVKLAWASPAALSFPQLLQPHLLHLFPGTSAILVATTLFHWLEVEVALLSFLAVRTSQVLSLEDLGSLRVFWYSVLLF